MFRAIKRKEVNGPAERKKKMETLSNLRRCIGSQTSASASVDELRSLIRGEAPTTASGVRTLPDSSESLGLDKFKAEMDEAEADVIAKQNDHFHFKKTVAPDWEEPVLWKNSSSTPDKSMLNLLLEERLKAEAERNAMDLDGMDVRSRKREEARKRERRAKKKRQMKKRRRANNVQRP